MTAICRGIYFCLLLCFGLAGASAATFTVGTYNVENYVERSNTSRPPKTEAARRKVHESIRLLKADVLALQEIGGTNALLALRSALKSEGVDYPYWEHVSGYDTNIFVAVLSKFPITARRSHARESFLLQGRRFRSSRGIVEIDIQPRPGYQFTLFSTHLKSRRPSSQADESEMREQEALILREKIDARLKADPRANIVVLGDFNDVKSSRSTKVIVGRGRTALTDTRPAEKNGDTDPNPNPRYEPRNVTWTHYYGVEDSYSRIDYLLISSGMEKEWDWSGTYILAVPNWGTGSDHRPLVARFHSENR